MKRLVSLVVLLAWTVAAAPAFSRSAPESFADLVEKLSPAVVNISTSQKVNSKMMGLPEMPDFPKGSPLEEFREFFEKFGLQPPGEGFGDQKAFSLGSGFVIDPSGYIVTNNHVISGAEEITVIFHDETKLDAEIIGRDPKTDLALLKVTSSKPLAYVPFGDSDDVRVGDWVLAIGNPFGFGGSVTAGIISARARDINAGPFDDFLQTDAAINRGNSGGPMFNTNGEVIGISTAIFSPSGGSVGIGFAVPSALAEPVIKQIREYGHPRRGWLGVKIQTVTEEIAESLGMKETKGALVVEVTKDSPAGKAGVKEGDVILTFDGKEVGEMRKLPRMVAESPIGKDVELDLLREGAKKTVEVHLGEMDEKEEQAPKKSKTGGKSKFDTSSLLGMELAPITGELREHYGMPETVKGLLVMGLDRGSEAAERGIREGDVIQSASGKPLASVNDLKEAIEAARKEGRKSALLRLQREDDTLFVTIPTEAPSKG